MNILYLHGLMSSHQTPKVSWLKDNGHHVYHPALNYKVEGSTIFSQLSSLLEKHDVALIIGSSMGGHLAYHLGNKFGIPTLLFNPSLAPNQVEKPEVDRITNTTILHTVVLGEKDDIVIPTQTIDYLNKANANYKHTFEENGHRTPIELLKKHFELIVS
ncbi:YqiA/YcfP family alpha/beta fold hydrolase [Nonlabens ponticola]|uniref:Alpha/beta fold hydrolase n=1 Tax=Nonlabens ponticola TaxID=2496866 RepID=A0A3S9MVZ8_9FLAO|nr:YqiA/YcfP family alpha/beta fold hydrolase [Nonlabens ponticola]AZQ43360.1 hypothetical protein EJ995_03580 [Nonlabens ponticola]